jgi:SNF family Na+-dependent transporter
MNEIKRFRPPIRLLIIAAILLISGLLVQPITSKPPEKVTATTVLITGIPFLLIFVAILLTYIALIVTISRYYSNNIAEKRFNPVFYACMAGIVIGIILMFQPFKLVLFTIGFLVLLFSLLSFIAVSHITPRKEAVEAQE